jgi:hypothetical protein
MEQLLHNPVLVVTMKNAREHDDLVHFEMAPQPRIVVHLLSPLHDRLEECDADGDGRAEDE